MWPKPKHYFAFFIGFCIGTIIAYGLTIPNPADSTLEPLLGGPESVLNRTILPERSRDELGTSTRPWARLTTNEICLSGDCETAWPVGGSSKWTDGGTYIYPATGESIEVSIISASSTATSSFGGPITMTHPYYLTTHGLRGDASDGLYITANNGTAVADFGIGNTANTSFYGAVNIDGATRLATSINGVLQATAGAVSATTTGTLTESITGLEFDNTRDLIGGGAVLSLTSGYSIPLTASTTEWGVAYASTTALTPTYIRGLFSNTATGLTYTSGTGITALTAGYSIPSTTDFIGWNLASSSRHSAVTLSGALDYITLVGQDIVRGAIDLATDITGTLPDDNGGTGQSTYTTGDMLYASASNVLSKRTIGSTGNILSVSGGVPTWVATNTLGFGSINNGTTGQVAYYDSNGSTISGTSTILIGANEIVDIGDNLSVWGSYSNPLIQFSSSSASTGMYIVASTTSSRIGIGSLAAAEEFIFDFNTANTLTLSSGSGVSAMTWSGGTFTTGNLRSSAVGGATAPVFSFSADTNTGMYKTSSGDSNSISFSASGTAMATINTTGVGISTTTPEAKLDVWGASSGKILTLFSNAGTKFMEMLDTGVTTLLGAWDFGGATSLEIPNGTNPTVDTLGEIALDTTGNQLVVATSTTAAIIPVTDVKIWSTTIASTSPRFLDSGLFPVPTNIDGYTITRIQCHVTSGTSKVIAIEDASGNSSEDITCATTNTTDDGSITNATYTASELSYIDFGATTGAVDYVSISVFGNWTRE